MNSNPSPWAGMAILLAIVAMPSGLLALCLSFIVLVFAGPHQVDATVVGAALVLVFTGFVAWKAAEASIDPTPTDNPKPNGARNARPTPLF